MMRQYRTLFLTVTAIVAACVVAIAAIYRQVQVKAVEKAQQMIRPGVDEGSVAEIGYVRERRRETNLAKRERRIMWWIRIPPTDKTYSCDWDGGYPDFYKDNAVMLIHSTADGNNPGFVVGLHGDQRGRSAAVSCVDVDELYE
jgi:hypothetical protein